MRPKMQPQSVFPIGCGRSHRDFQPHLAWHDMAEALPCSAIVYRAVARKDYIDPITGEVNPGAFLLRASPKDDDGLSVDVETARSCYESLKKCYGVVSLHVGRVRNLQLDVIPDKLTHANVTGLPRKEEDPTEANHLASQLAKLARMVPPRDIGTCCKALSTPKTFQGLT